MPCFRSVSAKNGVNDILSRDRSHYGSVHESEVTAGPLALAENFIALNKRHTRALGMIMRAHMNFIDKSEVHVTAT